MSYFDFNDAGEQTSFEPIPAGTLVRLRLSITPGGFDDPGQGWTGGWTTRSQETGSVYLACEGVVMDGPYTRRKLWWNIGLYSPKGPTWQAMGRSFLRALLNSARKVHPGDTGPQAQGARRIAGFDELIGLEFAARIDIEKDAKGNDRNTVRAVIEPDHRDYPAVMSSVPAAAFSSASSPASSPAATTPTGPASVPGSRPSWAR